MTNVSKEALDCAIGYLQKERNYLISEMDDDPSALKDGEMLSLVILALIHAQQV